MSSICFFLSTCSSQLTHDPYLVILSITQDGGSTHAQNIFKIILNTDIALLDGTFYSQNELPHRNIEEIPHPFILESIELFLELITINRNKIYFIHLNHSNPTLKLNSPEWIKVYKQGFNISKEDDIFRL